MCIPRLFLLLPVKPLLWTDSEQRVSCQALGNTAMCHRGGGQSVHFVYTRAAPRFVPLAQSRVDRGSSAKAQGVLSSPPRPRGSRSSQDKAGEKRFSHDPVTFNTSLCWDEWPDSMGTWGQRPTANTPQRGSHRHRPGSKMYEWARLLWHLGFFIQFGYLPNRCHALVFLGAVPAVAWEQHFPSFLPVHSKFLRNWVKCVPVGWFGARRVFLLGKCVCHVGGSSAFTGGQREARTGPWYGAPWQNGESGDGGIMGYGFLIQSRLRKEYWKMDLYL